MRSKRISLLLILALIASMIILPPTIQADNNTNAVTLIDISPNIGAPTMTETMGDGSMLVVGWWDEGGQPGEEPSATSLPSVGTEYTLRFSIEQEPMMVVGISDIQSRSYDAANKILTVKTKSISQWGLDRENSTWHKLDNSLMVAVGNPPDIDDDRGPPKEAAGMYISTNAQNWNIMPNGDMDQDGKHKPDSIRIKLTGKPGTSCFFKMFWPTALLRVMGVTPRTLTGFIDNDQANMRTKAVSGGALLSLRVRFPRGRSSSKLGTLATVARRIISTGKGRPINLRSNRRRIRRGSRVKLYGNTSPRKRGARVYIYRKYSGQRRYKRIGIARTNRRGNYRYIDKPAKSAVYVVKLVYRRRRRHHATVKRSNARRVRVLRARRRRRRRRRKK